MTPPKNMSAMACRLSPFRQQTKPNEMDCAWSVGPMKRITNWVARGNLYNPLKTKGG
jgi:hypothetical protein